MYHNPTFQSRVKIFVEVLNEYPTSEFVLSGPLTDDDKNSTITLELYWDQFNESGASFRKSRESHDVDFTSSKSSRIFIRMAQSLEQFVQIFNSPGFQSLDLDLTLLKLDQTRVIFMNCLNKLLKNFSPNLGSELMVGFGQSESVQPLPFVN